MHRPIMMLMLISALTTNLPCSVPAEMLAAIALIESNGRADAVSHAGAVGLMQVMPMDTRPPAELLVLPPVNVLTACRIIEEYMRHYGSKEQAMAAYFLGQGRVRRGEPLPERAKIYLHKLSQAEREVTLAAQILRMVGVRYGSQGLPEKLPAKLPRDKGTASARNLPLGEAPVQQLAR